MTETDASTLTAGDKVVHTKRGYEGKVVWNSSYMCRIFWQTTRSHEEFTHNQMQFIARKT